MLKYKKKQIVRNIMAVIIPILLITITILALTYYKKLDLRKIDVVKSTKNFFFSKDSSQTLRDKKTLTIDKIVEKKDNLSFTEIPAEDWGDDSIGEIAHFEGNTPAIYENLDTNQVVTDVLLAKKKYIIPISKKEIEIDSLLMNKNTNDKFIPFTLEFWVSPIGFSGYKKSKNKAILFGVTDIDNTELFIEDSKFYLIINSDLFLLEPSNEFSKLVPIQK